jgi:hypothetical protein
MKKREMLEVHPDFARQMRDLQRALNEHTGQYHSLADVSLIWYSSTGRPLIKIEDKKVKLI